MNLAVVFVSYLKVPEDRLQDHFVWNQEAYEQFGDRLRVYVVTDVAHDLPPYAECVIYPMERLPLVDGRRRFSLTKTKNAGIRQAIDDGADVIVSTDVDVRFPPGELEALGDVDRLHARFPVYHMIDYTDRDKLLRVDKGCEGTTSMTAGNWRRVMYDEDFYGYGGDDGKLHADVQAAGIIIIRTDRVDHIGHIPGDGDRTPGVGSASCWGREDGFNQDNLRTNKQIWREKKRGVRR